MFPVPPPPCPVPAPSLQCLQGCCRLPGSFPRRTKGVFVFVSLRGGCIAPHMSLNYFVTLPLSPSEIRAFCSSPLSLRLSLPRCCRLLRRRLVVVHCSLPRLARRKGCRPGTFLCYILYFVFVKLVLRIRYSFIHIKSSMPSLPGTDEAGKRLAKERRNTSQEDLGIIIFICRDEDCECKKGSVFNRASWRRAQ